jgi:hypothetical protein
VKVLHFQKNITLLGITIQIPRYKNCVGTQKRKVEALERGSSHKSMSSENNLMIIPPLWGQVIMLLTYWLQKENLFLMGNLKKKIPATQSVRDLSGE